MKKYLFSYNRGWNDVIEEVFEYDYDVSEEEINNDFQDWIWDLIGDGCHWEEIEG